MIYNIIIGGQLTNWKKVKLINDKKCICLNEIRNTLDNVYLIIIRMS